MEVENFVKTVQNIKGKNKLDLSAWEDLSIGLMNLVSLEEHAYFSYIKTQDESFGALGSVLLISFILIGQTKTILN